MIVSKIYLVTRNARDKVQVVVAELEQNGNRFTIKRSTGQYQGKMTEQPEVTIERGKAKRSVIEQANLEFNSKINKYLDKGYKRLDSLTTKKFEELSESEINEIVPTLRSDTNGNLKPMLAKKSEDCQNSVFNKPLYCSRKLDGVRCMIKIKWDEELQKVVTVSRGGKDYDVAASKIMAQLEPFLKEHPTYVFDGELYHHGTHLQTISGVARLKTWEDRCDMLEFWIYDLAIPELTFEERYTILEEFMFECEKPEFDKIKVIEHVLSSSWDDIQRLHDRWVLEGFEGLVARKPDKMYEFGKRGSTMIKVKQYKDDEFLIVDYQDGLRPEDFCFICETEDGKPFAAKPIGDRELKAWYLENINDIIGKKGKVKYFNYSIDGIPTQTIFQAVRYDEDIDKAKN